MKMNHRNDGLKPSYGRENLFLSVTQREIRTNFLVIRSVDNQLVENRKKKKKEKKEEIRDNTKVIS